MAKRGRRGEKQKGAGGDAMLGQKVLRRMQPLVSGWSREWLADDARAVQPRHFRLLALSPALSLPRIAPSDAADLGELLAPRETPMALNARFAAAGLGDAAVSESSGRYEAGPLYAPALETGPRTETGLTEWQSEPLQELVTDAATAALEIPYELLAQYQEGWDAVEADARPDLSSGEGAESTVTPRRMPQTSSARQSAQPSNRPARVQQVSLAETQQLSPTRMRAVARAAQGGQQPVRSIQPAQIQPASMPLAHSPSEQYSRLLAERVRRAQGQAVQPQQASTAQFGAQPGTLQSDAERAPSQPPGPSSVQGQIPPAQGRQPQSLPQPERAQQVQSRQAQSQPVQQQTPHASQPVAQPQPAQWDARKSKASAIAERIERAALMRERGEAAPVYSGASGASAASVMDQRLAEGVRRQLAEREGVDPVTLGETTAPRKPTLDEAAKRAERWRAFSRVEVLSTATPAPAEEGVLPRATPPRPEDRAAIQGVSSKPGAPFSDEGERAVIDLGAVEVVEESPGDTPARAAAAEVPAAGEFDEDGDLIDAEYELRGATDYALPTYEASPASESGAASVAPGEEEFEDFEAMLAAMEDGDEVDAELSAAPQTDVTMSDEVAAQQAGQAGVEAKAESATPPVPEEQRPQTPDQPSAPDRSVQAVRAEASTATDPAQPETTSSTPKGRGKGTKGKRGASTASVEAAQTVASESIAGVTTEPDTSSAPQASAPVQVTNPASQTAPDFAESIASETAASAAQIGAAIEPARVSSDLVTPAPGGEQGGEADSAASPGPSAAVDTIGQSSPVDSQNAEGQFTSPRTNDTQVEARSAQGEKDTPATAEIPAAPLQVEGGEGQTDSGVRSTQVATAPAAPTASSAPSTSAVQRSTDRGLYDAIDPTGESLAEADSQPGNLLAALDAQTPDLRDDMPNPDARAVQSESPGDTALRTPTAEGYETVMQPTQPVRVKSVPSGQDAASGSGDVTPGAAAVPLQTSPPNPIEVGAGSSESPTNDTVGATHRSFSAVVDSPDDTQLAANSDWDGGQGVDGATPSNVPHSRELPSASVAQPGMENAPSAPPHAQRRPEVQGQVQDDMPLVRPPVGATDAISAEQAAPAGLRQPLAAPTGDFTAIAPEGGQSEPLAPQTELEAWVHRSLEALFAEGATVSPPIDEVGKQALAYIETMRHEAMAERALKAQTSSPGEQERDAQAQAREFPSHGTSAASPIADAVQLPAGGADAHDASAGPSGRAQAQPSHAAPKASTLAMPPTGAATPAAAGAPAGVIQRTPVDDLDDDRQSIPQVESAPQLGRAERNGAAQATDETSVAPPLSNGHNTTQPIARASSMPTANLSSPAAFASPPDGGPVDDMPLVHHRRNGSPRPVDPDRRGNGESVGVRQFASERVTEHETGAQQARKSEPQAQTQPAAQSVTRRVPDSVVRQAYGIAPPTAAPPAIGRVASNVVQATSVEVVQRAEGDAVSRPGKEVRDPVNLAEIARMVYPLLKDMLRLERDRFGR